MKNIIENWFLVDIDLSSPYVVRVVLPEAERVAVCGEFNNEIAIFFIADINDGRLVTEDGEEYEFGKMHPDYKELLLAKRTNIPILESWRLKEVEDLFDDSSGLSLLMDLDTFIDFYNANAKHKGYLLIGTCGDETICGEIIVQKGNFVTLSCFDPFTGSLTNLELLVIWPNIGETEKKEILMKALNKSPTEEMDWSFSIACRPRIKPAIF